MGRGVAHQPAAARRLEGRLSAAALALGRRVSSAETWRGSCAEAARRGAWPRSRPRLCPALLTGDGRVPDRAFSSSLPAAQLLSPQAASSFWFSKPLASHARASAASKSVGTALPPAGLACAPLNGLGRSEASGGGCASLAAGSRGLVGVSSPRRLEGRKGERWVESTLVETLWVPARAEKPGIKPTPPTRTLHAPAPLECATLDHTPWPGQGSTATLGVGAGIGEVVNVRKVSDFASPSRPESWVVIKVYGMRGICPGNEGDRGCCNHDTLK